MRGASAWKPELKQLASGVSITTDANKVRINARFPYEVLDSLRAKKAARAVEPETAIEPAN